MRPPPILAAALLATGMARAQQPIPSPLSFEAASVHENVSGEHESSQGDRPGGYAATNVALRPLIIDAYRLRSFQVVGGPGWIDSARFDVVARAAVGSDPADVYSMLRTLLAERFALRVHTEMRERPVYALVPARRDRRLGPRLALSEAACGPAGAENNACRMSGRFVGTRGGLKGVGQPLSQLATHLSTAVDRLVVDRSGLTGVFDFEVEWSGGGFRAPAPAQGAPADEGPSVFTAVQEQLGLRLEPARGPVETLVIDSAARPQPD